MGLDRRWRKKVLEDLRPGMRVLDLGCGTGDLSIMAARQLGRNGEVVGLDFSENMLAIAERRYKLAGSPMNGHFRLVRRKAEELPFESEGYDRVVSGFVLRNLYENIDAIFKGVHRSLKPGGQVRLLDFTEPPNRAWLALWRAYMNAAAAVYGRALFGKAFPYLYLTQSAARFPKAAEVRAKLEEAGFTGVRSRTFMGGVIVLYEARKA